MIKMQLEIINKKINETIKQITLPQGIRITCLYLKKFYPNEKFEDLYENIVFKSNTSLSFQRSEIHNINFLEYDNKVKAEITLNFLGIFGSSSPMPSHLSEMVLDSIDSDMILYDFLNLFNHHLQKFIYPIWEKHRYYIQYRQDLNDRFSKYILSLLGLYSKSKTNSLNLQKLIPYIGLLSMKQKSSGSLKAILKQYLNYEDIDIVECIPTKYEIPAWQNSVLGEVNMSLGKDFLIGEEIISKNTKFQILLKNAKAKDLYEYSLLSKKTDQVKELVSFVLNEHLEHEICLDIKKEEKDIFSLDENNRKYLGINCWIGDSNYDEKIILAQKG